MVNFIERLRAAQERNQSRLCIGLDPDPEKIPIRTSGGQPNLLEWGLTIVDATAEFGCTFKPNLAFWCAVGAHDQLIAVIHYIQNKYHLPVTADGKRNDIGNTARLYAKEVFDFYNGDAATVNPYLGWDGIEPFVEYDRATRGVFALCRTSNKSAPEFQGNGSEIPPTSHQPLYLQVAQKTAEWRKKYPNLGLVVGATYPAELKAVRHIVGLDCPILIPGVGKQGADVKATLAANAGGLAVINSSSAIIHASTGADFAEAAAVKARETRDLINECWEG